MSFWKKKEWEIAEKKTVIELKPGALEVLNLSEDQYDLKTYKEEKEKCDNILRDMVHNINDWALDKDWGVGLVSLSTISIAPYEWVLFEPNDKKAALTKLKKRKKKVERKFALPSLRRTLHLDAINQLVERIKATKDEQPICLKAMVGERSMAPGLMATIFNKANAYLSAENEERAPQSRSKLLIELQSSLEAKLHSRRGPSTNKVGKHYVELYEKTQKAIGAHNKAVDFANDIAGPAPAEPTAEPTGGHGGPG